MYYEVLLLEFAGLERVQLEQLADQEDVGLVR